MKVFAKIILWAFFDIALGLSLLAAGVLYWSYGHKKPVPSQFLTHMETMAEGYLPGSRMFIGSADIEFLDFSRGLHLNLNNSYFETGKNIVVSIPHIEMGINLKDILNGRITLRNMTIDRPRFVVSTEMNNNFSNPVSHDFFNLYKLIVYGLFDKIDKKGNALPVEKIDIRNAEFSFNKNGSFEVWKIESAGLRFFSLQNTTYLSTSVKSDFYGHKSVMTVNARLLENDRVMLKAEYKNLPAGMVTGFMESMAWFNELSPVLNGTSSLVMERTGLASSASVEADIQFEKKEVSDTRIGFSGTMDLGKNDDTAEFIPQLHGRVKLKDVDMEKLPVLWPEKYGTKVRVQVLKNYTNGTFNNVTLNFDFKYSDMKFSRITSEKYSIRGDIVNTDVLYNPNFPPVEKVSGRFHYDGESVMVDMEKGFIGKLEFGPSKVNIQGLGTDVVVLEIDGSAKGDLAELKPLMKSIFKGRDAKFFYNTRELQSDSDIKFYYRDNVKKGFDPAYLKMDIAAHLNKVIIKDVIKGVDLTSDDMDMSIDGQGLHFTGGGYLNDSASNIDVELSFTKPASLAININSSMQPETVNRIVPGITDYSSGDIGLEFEYKSEGDRNYFAGKLDATDAEVNFPYMAWNKPKGEVTSISFGGKYIDSKAIELSDLKIVTKDSISSGRAVFALDDKTTDEIYIDRLALGRNDAELYFSRTYSGANKSRYPSYIIKVNGKSFDASRLVGTFNKTATGNSPMVFDMSVEKLILANDVKLLDAKAHLTCGTAKCYRGNLSAAFEDKGNVAASYFPEDPNNIEGVRIFNVKSDNAGAVVRALGISGNINGGTINVNGSLGKNPENTAEGTVEMKDFKLTRTPILTQIFSLASFTGMLNLLTNTGVTMTKLEGNFVMKNDYLIITGLNSYGDSLGFTSEGNIDFSKGAVDLSGAVTPSYTINSLLGRVPLVGGIFRGKSGEGFISTNYHVTGKYPDNVKVSVNPLSTLTPGFLRNIWGGGAKSNINPNRDVVKEVVEKAEDTSEKEPPAPLLEDARKKLKKDAERKDTGVTPDK